MVDRSQENSLFRIADVMERAQINTDNLLNTDLSRNPLVKKIINQSDLIDNSWREIIKAEAIVNPSKYIADRARLIKSMNNQIAEKMVQYENELNDDDENNQFKNLPYSKKKLLLERKLIGLVSDYYTEVNIKYPINNLATSLQNAISTAYLRQPEKESPTKKRGKK